MDNKRFWAFKELYDKHGELLLYGPISDSSWLGDEITPAQFARDLAGLGQIEQLDVFVNSPGGDAFAGISIYHILKRSNAYKTVHIDGIAASAASVIAMAGDKIVMPKAATMMIHNALAIGMGTKTDMLALADELQRLDGQLAQIYSDRTGKESSAVAKWMNEERWMSGSEAFTDGFCDEVEPNKAIAACADVDKFFARYQHPPRVEPEPEKEPEPETAKQGGFVLPADNGAEMQPVADITDLADQRKWHNSLKRKLLEV